MRTINVQEAIDSRRGGGDLWNPVTIAHRARRAVPKAETVTIRYQGTGLWVDAIIHTTDGRRIERRLFS